MDQDHREITLRSLLIQIIWYQIEDNLYYFQLVFAYPFLYTLHKEN